MACKVKNISVAFDPSSKRRTFTNGDLISGRVTFEVAKKTHIEGLFVKAEGEASVLWSENHGKHNVVVYHDKVTCFKSIQYFIQDQKKECSIFTNGDFISGRVTLKVEKETHIESLFVKAKGKASVLWTEHHGKNSTVVYYDKETCFKSIQYFIQEEKIGQDGYSMLTNEYGQSYSRVVDPGVHVYPFTFQLPHQDMPASFKGSCGKVVYFLEATLCRSMAMAKKAKVHFNYVPRGDTFIPDLMLSQHGYKQKKMKFLTSGNVAMDVHTEKMGFHSGEQIKVRVDIVNNSSRTIKPKFILYQKQSCFALKKKNVHTKELMKDKGDPIDPSTNQCVTKVFNIPADICVSILNCKVLKVEYRLKVYLDIKFAFDPKISLPVVILPASVTEKYIDEANTDMGIKDEIMDQQASGLEGGGSLVA